MKEPRPPMPFGVLTKEQDQRVRGRVKDRAVKVHEDNWKPLEDDEWLMLDMPSGREALAFYRAQGMEWWLKTAGAQMDPLTGEMTYTYPDRARWHAKQFAALARKYGPPSTLAVVA